MKSKEQRIADAMQRRMDEYHKDPVAYENKKALKKILAIAFFGFVSLIFIVFFVSHDKVKVEQNVSSTPSFKYELPRVPDNAAWVMSQHFAKRHLKSPSTAEFPFEDVIVHVNIDTYTVLAPVDAQNTFGGMMRSTYVCAMVYKGGETYRIANWESLGVIIK